MVPLPYMKLPWKYNFASVIPTGYSKIQCDSVNPLTLTNYTE